MLIAESPTALPQLSRSGASTSRYYICFFGDGFSCGFLGYFRIYVELFTCTVFRELFGRRDRIECEICFQKY
ncbi:unnamed protein product [Litomosoides sigmodontis]|uniref:Uncharacterized protein n=1 Tax=Litomosoides sigmodontis TaxID=42156 RepID=A0A3P6TDD1_LITSI|nr:unnamed protein product [Litomosoides sigmodontis]